MLAARTPATSGVDPHGLFKLPSKLKKTLTADHASVAVYAQIIVRDFFVKHGYTAALEKFEAEQREMDQRAHVPKAHADGAARNRLRVENMVESFCDDSEVVDAGADGASAASPSRTQRWVTDEDGLVERLLHSLIDQDGARALDAIESMPGGFSVGRSYVQRARACTLQMCHQYSRPSLSPPPPASVVSSPAPVAALCFTPSSTAATKPPSRRFAKQSRRTGTNRSSRRLSRRRRRCNACSQSPRRQSRRAALRARRRRRRRAGRARGGALRRAY